MTSEEIKAMNIVKTRDLREDTGPGEWTMWPVPPNEPGEWVIVDASSDRKTGWSKKQDCVKTDEGGEYVMWRNGRDEWVKSYDFETRLVQ